MAGRLTFVLSAHPADGDVIPLCKPTPPMTSMTAHRPGPRNACSASSTRVRMSPENGGPPLPTGWPAPPAT